MKLSDMDTIISEEIYNNLDDLAKEICQYILEHYSEFRKRGLDLYSIVKKYCYDHPSPDTKRIEDRLAPFSERNTKKRAVKIYNYAGNLKTADAVERAYEDCIKIYISFNLLNDESDKLTLKRARKSISHEMVHVFDDLGRKGKKGYSDDRSQEYKWLSTHFVSEIKNHIPSSYERSNGMVSTDEWLHNKLSTKNDLRYIKYGYEFEQYIQRFLRRCQKQNDKGQSGYIIRSYRQLLSLIFGAQYYKTHENDSKLKKMIVERLKKEDFPDNPKYNVKVLFDLYGNQFEYKA